MAYIGNDPVIGEFIELDALTASSTADYTLTRNGAAYKPATVNNLLVSINGVIQGGSTMSLNGNTLTVGATLSSSDTIDFVRVLGSVGNVSEPTDGSVTSAKLATGSVTSAKLANDIAVTTLDVATIRASNGTTAATIDSTGRLLTPARPRFLVNRSADSSQTATSWNTVPFDTELFDVGDNYNLSTNEWTCPLTGFYQFNYGVRIEGGDAASFHLGALWVDGSGSGTIHDISYYISSSTEHHSTIQKSFAVNVSAGTVLQLKYIVGDSSHTVKMRSSFGGYLVG